MTKAMNCETLRERLAEDPARSDTDFDRHAEECAACQAYRSRLLRAEELIHRAVRFDISSAGSPSHAALGASSVRSGWVIWASGLAAGLLIAVTFWGFFGSANLSAEALARQVVNHWYHEPESWVDSDSPVSATLLTEVLDGEADIDLAALATVSYAETCWVAGEWIAHLVVQGTAGPYMVLLMPRRMLESPIPLQLPEEGLSGNIVPLGTGSIAVLGRGQSAELEQMEDTVVAAIDWTI